MPATKEKTYNDAEIAQRLEELPGWYYEDGWIRRVYKTDGWPTTTMLVNAVAYLAEAAYHHPDLSVTWGRLTVKLQNHAAGGITDKDFELARKIDEMLAMPEFGISSSAALMRRFGSGRVASSGLVLLGVAIGTAVALAATRPKPLEPASRLPR